MLTKNDFSASDWKTLRDAQYLAGLATLMADSSGFGTIKESMALAQSIMENQASNFPFIRDLTSKAEMTAATIESAGDLPAKHPTLAHRAEYAALRSAVAAMERLSWVRVMV